MAMLAAAAMGSLGSCSSDELLDGTNTLPENAIAFNVTQQGALSRGTETNSGNFQNQIKDFQVWAYFDKSATGTGVTPGGLYVGDSHTVGTKVNGDSNGAWSYDDVTKQQYWPATTAPLNFQAITPYAHSSFTIENTPDVADPKLAHVTANVTVPTAVADQQDIMFAKADGQTRETNSQTVGLNFQHGMSQVVFNGKLASDKIEATVHGIEIHNLHNTGKVGYMGTNAELQAQTTGVAATTFAAGLVSDAKVTSSSQATVLSAADGALFMLPQTVAKWTTTAKNPVPTSEADANHNSYLKVTCTVKDKASGVVLVNNGAIYIPLDVNWQQGKKYSYTLVFGQGEQGFKPDGSHDDNLLQIKYSVDAENWNAAGNEDLGMGGGFERPLQPLIYTTNRAKNIKIINKAELCKSVIFNGKEYIQTGMESGPITIYGWSFNEVYITFKDDITDFSEAFDGCDALTEIPENLFANCPKVNTFFQTFALCKSLKSIPTGLFAHNPEVTDFSGTFMDCSTLKSIPENLFANCPKVTDFSETFDGCAKLTSIPENLFANCPKVTTFGRHSRAYISGAFSNCTSLTTIPEKLFAHNPEVTNFYGTFQSCTSLKSIPENLFTNNPAVTSFAYTFAECRSLTSIPENLFANNPEVTNFSGTFWKCSALKSIPENLFANNPEVTNFAYTFGGCTSLTTIPEKLFANNPSAAYFCGMYSYETGTFQGCTSLQSIPENLFANNPEVTNFSGTFWKCSALKSIPENLFASNPKVTSFNGTFYGCSALTAIPEGLFANNPKVISLYRTFEGCKSLKSIPEQLFANNTEVTNFSGTFAEGTALISIPAGLFDNNRKVSDFSYTFYGCSALTGESPYTMIGDQKVHIYERNNYLYIFSKIENRTGTFSGCNGLTDLQSNSI